MYTKDKFIQKDNKKDMLKKILLLCAGITILGVGYYFISPFFITVQLDEPLPIIQDVSLSVTDTDQPAPEATNLELEIQSGLSTSSGNKPASVVTPVPETPIIATVVGTKGHPASGTARLLATAAGSFVRFENFKTINGPDLFVYLATDLEATEFVDLGRLKATEGNINYAIPDGTNVEKYPYVMVWCKQFGVLFNSAKIQ